MFRAKGIIHLNKNSSTSVQKEDLKYSRHQSATTLLELEPFLGPIGSKNQQWWHFFIVTVLDLALWAYFAHRNSSCTVMYHHVYFPVSAFVIRQTTLTIIHTPLNNCFWECDQTYFLHICYFFKLNWVK